MMNSFTSADYIENMAPEDTGNIALGDIGNTALKGIVERE